MSVSLRFLCLCSAAMLPLASLEAKPSSKVTVRLLADKVTDAQEKFILRSDQGKSEPLELPVEQLSEPVPVSARTFTLSAAESDAVLCSVTLPPEGKSFSVLFVSEEAAKYSPVVVRTDDRTFKDGDVFFVNHTTKVILLKLGATELEIEPGKSTTSRPTKPEDNSYEIVISERGQDGDRVISSSRWQVEKGLRSYVFLTEKDDGKTTYRAVDEYVEVSR